MQHANIDGTNLEYMIQGRRGAEPVVFIHGSVIANANAPLIEQPIFMNRCYYLISYYRRGFAGSSSKQIDNHVSISKQALDCQKIMWYLNGSVNLTT